MHRCRPNRRRLMKLPLRSFARTPAFLRPQIGIRYFFELQMSSFSSGGARNRGPSAYSMRRRKFLQAIGSTPGGVFANAAAQSGLTPTALAKTIVERPEPTVFFFDDGRHAAAL